MPAPALAALAKKAGVPLEKAEQYYEQAKTAAAKTYDESKESEKFYGTVTKIVKSKLGLKEGRDISDINRLIEQFKAKEKDEKDDDGEDADKDKPDIGEKKKENGKDAKNGEDEEEEEEEEEEK